jgi:hypothetical protein
MTVNQTLSAQLQQLGIIINSANTSQGTSTSNPTTSSTTTTSTTSNGKSTTSVNTTVIVVNPTSNTGNNGGNNGGNTAGSTGGSSAGVNCAQANNGVCVQCNQNFVLASGVCKAMDINCASYQLSTGICQSCISNYNLQNGVCVQAPAPIQNCQVVNPSNSSNCLVCVNGYYPSGSICAAVSQYCNGYNPQTGACYNCLYGLTLNSNGKCLDSNCIGTKSDGTCATCVATYSLSPYGVCQFVDPNCATFNGSACVNCNSGYYITVKGICVALPAGCKYGNPQLSGQCVQCMDGYTLNSSKGTCSVNQVITPSIPNCAIVQNNICQSCMAGYYISSGACVKASVLCSLYSNGVCAACVTGYLLANGVCIDVNCQNQADNSCLACKTNFKVLPSSTLCVYYDPNCQTSTSNSCAVCNNGFAVGNSGLC